MRKQKSTVREDYPCLSPCMDKGLSKLVPSKSVGGLPFTRYGEIIEDPVEPHLMVSLLIHPVARGLCVITIKDGDNFILQRWVDFNVENWHKQIDLYNLLERIDPDTIEYLIDHEGFS